EEQSPAGIAVSGKVSDELSGLPVDERDAVLDRAQAAQAAHLVPLGLGIVLPGWSKHGQPAAVRAECRSVGWADVRKGLAAGRELSGPNLEALEQRGRNQFVPVIPEESMDSAGKRAGQIHSDTLAAVQSPIDVNKRVRSAERQPLAIGTERHRRGVAYPRDFS